MKLFMSIGVDRESSNHFMSPSRLLKENLSTDPGYKASPFENTLLAVRAVR